MIFTVAVTLAWLIVPGLLIGLALGLRGWLLTAAAAPLTFGFVGAASFAFDFADVRWRPLSVVVAAILVALPLGALSRPWRVRPEVGNRWTWLHHAGVAAVLLGAGALAVRSISRATGGLTTVNQTWDAFFHGAAVRLIAESGNASPYSLGPVSVPAAPSSFAPDAYHATAALVYSTTGDAIPLVLNAMAAATPLVLGAGIVALFRVTTTRPAHAATGALLSMAVAALPYHMIGYGALLPYGSTLVMLPGVAALVSTLLASPNWRIGVALAIAAAGLVYGHPQAAVLAAIVTALQVGWHLVGARRIEWPLARSAALSLVVVGVLSAPVVGSLVSAAGVAGGAAGIDWPAYTTPGGAFGDLVLFNSVTRFPQWWLVPLFMVGLWAVLAHRVLRPLRPIVAAGLVFAGLYVLAGGLDGPLSMRYTSFWWNDRNRLAAAFAIVAIVLAAVGLVHVRDKVIEVLRRFGTQRLDARLLRWAPAAVLAVGLVAFVVVTRGNYSRTAEATIGVGYGNGPTLASDERAGLAELAKIVANGGGGTVMNDPHDGCGWAYALSGTQVIFPTPLTGPFDWANLGYDRERLYEEFDELDTDTAVRAATRGLDVRWAATCTGFIRTWQERAPGLNTLDTMRSASLVYSNGAVRLYRVTAPAN